MNHLLFTGRQGGAVKIDGIIVPFVGLDKNFVKAFFPTVLVGMVDQFSTNPFPLVCCQDRRS